MNINELKNLDAKILVIGNHPAITQSVLDFDFLSGKNKPSILSIISAGRNYQRFFYGRKEILIPVFESVEKLPKDLKEKINMFINVSSGRRVLTSSIEAIDNLKNIKLATVFAENVPEKHAIDLGEYARVKDVTIIGPASVGIVIPEKIKLGAIAGVNTNQIETSGILNKGGVAVLSASGGMVNEIINIVGKSHNKLSLALSFGGDRFPLLEPLSAFKSLEEDDDTKAVIYYGELGGEDEYKLSDLLESGKFTKKVICYIAGTVSDLFDTPPQFGHAKAIANKKEESAKAKRETLREAGAIVPETFSEFVNAINSLDDFETLRQSSGQGADKNVKIENMDDRKHVLIASSISKDEDGDVKILGEDLVSFAKDNSFAKIAASLFLGKKINSQDTEDLVDFILRISVDHGPYVSGALNTIVSARAGKDLVSSLASGLLTIGPRFGGALNQAALNWFSGVADEKSAYDFVEEFAQKKEYIQGIGHKKYRVDMPDPRIGELKRFIEKLDAKRFINFALEVEKITTEKKGNLILNVDGMIAAVLLDYLSEKEGYSDEQLWKLIQAEFFNALFVLSRSTGFIAHFLDQKRLDEGLLRLSEDDVADASQ